MKFKMADKDLLVNNLQHYFGILKLKWNSFSRICSAPNTPKKPCWKLVTACSKSILSWVSSKWSLVPTTLVLGKLNATEHDHNVWNSLLIRYNKLIEMLGLGIRCTIKLIENLEPNGTCLIPEIYPDLCGLVSITSSYTGDMISNITRDIFYFQDNPTSPWFDIGDPIHRPKSPSTTPTYPDSPIAFTPSDLQDTLNTTTQDIGTSQAT